MPTADNRSCILVTTPTSGSGSTWRILNILRPSSWAYSEAPAQISADSLPAWEPPAEGSLHIYNRTHIVNENLRSSRLVFNFRDPRDLCCNQFHWVFHHPSPLPPEQLAARRAEVRAMGIDEYVKGLDNTIHYRMLHAYADHIRTASRHDVFVSSYARLCLDMDNLVAELADFLGNESLSAQQKDLLENERIQNLPANTQWVGNSFGGSDIAPGRYLRELKPETIQFLDKKYSETLAFLREFEAEPYRHLLETGRHSNQPSALESEHAF